LNGTHQRLVSSDYINLFGESISLIKKNEEAPLDASKDVHGGVNAGKTTDNYMCMPYYQNAGQTHNIKLTNTSFKCINGRFQVFG
jgi:hypothetical protein